MLTLSVCGVALVVVFAFALHWGVQVESCSETGLGVGSPWLGMKVLWVTPAWLKAAACWNGEILEQWGKTSGPSTSAQPV